MKSDFMKHMGEFGMMPNIKINLKIIKIQENLMCVPESWAMLICVKTPRKIYSEQVCEIIGGKKVQTLISKHY